MVKAQEILWVFEDEEAEADRLGAFAEIPAHVRVRIDREVEREVLDGLHAAAVERGDLPPPPTAYFEELPGKIARSLFLLGAGAVVGTAAVILALYMLRSYAHVI